MTLFDSLEEIFRRPAPYERMTTADLWTDPHVAAKMLEYHLDPEMDLSSRNHAFIEHSAAWITERFGLGPGKKVCDLGCGPGLYTGRFAAAGAETWGVDFSANSLDYARRVAAEQGRDIRYLHRNYLEFATETRFDLITMIFCDFCALAPDERQRLLAIMRDHLAEGGRIFMDVCSMRQFAGRQEQRSYEYCEDDGFWSPGPHHAFHAAFVYPDQRVSLDKFVIVEPNRSREILAWLCYYDQEALAAEFARAGLAVEATYANVAGDPAGERDQEIAVCARRMG